MRNLVLDRTVPGVLRVVAGVATLGFVTGVVVIPVTPSSGATTPGLALRYTFNEDTTTSIRDSSGSGLSGVLVNANPDTAFVRGAPTHKKGLRLVATQRQYVSVPNSDATDLDHFTMAAWVHYSGTTTPDTKGRWEVLEKAGSYWLNIRTNGLVRAGGFFGGCEDGRYWHYLDSSTSVPVKTWTHVSATYDGAALTIYINGELSSSMSVSGATCPNDEPLAIGAKNAPAKGILEAFWDGRLDDVRLYDKALSADRIVRLAG